MNIKTTGSRVKTDVLRVPDPLISIFACMFILSGCRKDLTEVSSPETARVSFYNASEEITQQWGTDFYGCILFLDSVTRNKEDIFFRESPRFNSTNYRFQYPNDPINAGLQQPWVNYLRIEPGPHTVNLVDTALHTLYESQFDAPAEQASTVLFTDSLGKFQRIILRNEEKILPNSARIRLLQMSPDCGPIITSLDGQVSNSLSVQRFAEVSPYAEVPLPAGSDTLKIQVYANGDTSLVAAGALFQARQGHSYTMILSGYVNFQSYLNAAGEERNIYPDLKLKIIEYY
jgi:hypothetical protein